MNWNTEGPWGKNTGDQKPENKPDPSSQSPWGRSGGPSNGGGDEPPDFSQLWQTLRDQFGSFKPKGGAHSVLIAAAVLVGLWLASGIYMVGADQLGVVMRFGAFDRTAAPGLRYHLPAPFEEVLLPVVTSQNEIQIGFRKAAANNSASRPFPQESLMLTQDENIINVEFAVFWRITDVNKFLFQIRNPETTIKMAAESAMREVIGQNRLQFALTEGRGQIAEEARTRLQALVNEYKAGVTITQINLQNVSVPADVRDAFQDVVNARLDMERFQNQAAAHVNKVIPDARGQAAKLEQQSMAYRDQKIAIAKGEADRFKEVLAAYNISRDVTARRLYLETMQDVLSGANKVITDGKNAGTVPLYPLQDMLKKHNAAQGDK